MIYNKVYHGTSIGNLDTIKINKAVNGIGNFVFAARNKTIATLFVSNELRDKACKIGVENGIPYIEEQYKGAFNKRHEGKSGYIYELSGKNFEENRTDWNEDLVSEYDEKVLNSFEIKDVKEFLLDLQRKGELKIYYYQD